MIKYLTVLLLLFVSSDNIEYKLLADNVTKVPADPDYFIKNYREKYEAGIPEGVEPNVLYIASHMIIKGMRLHNFNKWPEYESNAIMFYQNGCVNIFKADERFPKMTLNPLHHGKRGIHYKKRRKNLITIIELKDDGSNGIEPRTEILMVKGDTLITKGIKLGYETFYIKQKDKNAIKTNYTANW